MFHVKFFNKLVFFGISFFLVSSFVCADDALRKEDNLVQKNKTFHTKFVQQNQESRSQDYSVEIVLPASVQKLKDRAQELLATIDHRKDVHQASDQLAATKKRLQDFLKNKLVSFRPKLATLGGDEFGLQISSMALPFPEGSSEDSDSSSEDISIVISHQETSTDSGVSYYESSEEDVVKKDEYDDYYDRRNRDEEDAKLKKIALEKKRLKKERDDLLAFHGYVFKLSEKTQKELDEVSKKEDESIARQKNSLVLTMSTLGLSIFFPPALLGPIVGLGALFFEQYDISDVVTKVKLKAEKEKEEWEEQALKSIEIKIKNQEEQVKIEAQKEEEIKIETARAVQEAEEIKKREEERVKIVKEAEERLAAEQLVRKKINFEKILEAKEEKKKVEALIQKKFEDLKSVHAKALEEKNKDKIEELKKEPIKKSAWGDNLGFFGKELLTKVGLRESDAVKNERIAQEQVVLREQKKLRIREEKELQKIETINISCQEIRAIVAAAIARGDKTWQLADIPEDCYDCLEKKENIIKNSLDLATSSNKSDKNHSNFNKKYTSSLSSSKSGSSDVNSSSSGNKESRCIRSEDIVHDGKRCKQYLFIDEKGQCKGGCLESYDGKSGEVFAFINPVVIEPNKSVVELEQFIAERSRSIINSKEACIKRDRAYQDQQIASAVLSGNMSVDQANAVYAQRQQAEVSKQIEQAVKYFQAQEKIDLLPKGGIFPFQSAQNQDGKISTNKQGDPLDNKGNVWKLDEERQEWNVYNKSGHLVNKNPIKVDISKKIELYSQSIIVINPSREIITEPIEEAQSSTAIHFEPDINGAIVIPSSQAQLPKNQISGNLIEPKPLVDRSDLDVESEKFAISDPYQSTQLDLKPVESKPENIIEFDVPKKFTEMVDKPGLFEKPNEPTSFQSAHDQRRRQILDEQEKWKESRDLRHVDYNQLVMIDDIHAAIVDAKNDMIVELAQASLQAWSDAQNAQSFDEYDACIKKSEKLYDQLQRDKLTTSLSKKFKQPGLDQVDELLKKFTTILAHQDQDESLGQSRGHIQGHVKNDYADRLKKRTQALQESKEQLCTGNLEDRRYELSHEARGFMMAHNLNYTAFDGGKVTNFQHCLTQEILGVIESSVEMGQRHNPRSMIADLVRYNCQLAVSAQQLNQGSRLDEAVAITDLTHVFAMYGRSILDDELEAAAWQAIGTGAGRAVAKWGQFVRNAWNEPEQTMASLAQTCHDTAELLAVVAGQIHDRTPLHYLGDITDDFKELMQARSGEKVDLVTIRKNRNEERLQRNEQSLQTALLAVQKIIDDIQQKPMQDTIADTTEIIVDNILTGKITQGLLNLCQIVGDKTLQAAQSFKDMLPPDLMDKPLNFATQAGELIATIESTGESVGEIVASRLDNFSDKQQGLIKKLAQAHNAKNKAQKSFGDAGKQKVEPEEGTAEWNNLHPYGKYKESSKHHAHSKGNISKPPHNGQAALDNSFGIKDYPHRIAIEDDQFVILRKTLKDEFHGYRCDWKDVSSELQAVLREKKLVHSKSGKIL